MYYTYILRCEDNSLYTGITTDVERRFMEHLLDEKKGAKYTKRHIPQKIEAYWESSDKKLASRLEFYIKKLSKQQKERLIKDNNFTVFSGKIEMNEYKKIL